MFLQRLKEVSFPRRRVFLPQLLQHSFKNGQRPALLEKFLGRRIVRRLAKIAVFGSVIVEGENGLRPAALGRVLAVPVIRQKVFQRGEQEGTELPFLLFHSAQRFLFEQVGEKALR